MHQNTLQLFQRRGGASAPLPMPAGAHAATSFSYKVKGQGQMSKNVITSMIPHAPNSAYSFILYFFFPSRPQNQ